MTACRRLFATIVFIGLVPPIILSSNAKTPISDCVRIWEFSTKDLAWETTKPIPTIPNYSWKTVLASTSINWPRSRKGSQSQHSMSILSNLSVRIVRIEIDIRRNCQKNVRNADRSPKSKCRRHATSAIRHSKVPLSCKFILGTVYG